MQMDSSSVPIAIGEPIGGGLFVSNIVLGAVCFIAGGSSGSVPIEKKAFLRDTLFYAGSILVVGLVLYDEQVLLCCHLVMLSTPHLDMTRVLMYTCLKHGHGHEYEQRHSHHLC